MSLMPKGGMDRSSAEGFREEFRKLRESGADLSLDSQRIRERQVEKTDEALEVKRQLRLDSEARSKDQRIGGLEVDPIIGTT